MNAYEKLNRLLSREEKDVFFSLWREVVNDQYVVQEQRTFSTDELRSLLRLIQTGFAYIAGKYGSRRFPETISFLSRINAGGKVVTGVIAYHPTADEGRSGIFITPLYAARMIDAIRDGCRLSDSNLPPDTVVAAEDHVILAAVEECCHHLHYLDGMRVDISITIFERDHPSEQAVRPFIVKAIEDLHIVVYPATGEMKHPRFDFTA